MEQPDIKEATFNEKELFDTLKTAVATSKRILMDDAILLILWGCTFSFGFLWNYINSTILISSRIQDLMLVIKPVSAILLIIFTTWFLFIRKKKVHTYTAISTRFVWIGIIIAHNLNVIVTRNYISEVSFELLHPLQMVLVGFALFVTGGIYRYYILTLSGIVMWVAAMISIQFELETQFLTRAIADFICFVVPGFLMLVSSKKQSHV